MRIDLQKDVVSLTDFARNTREHTEDLAKGGRARVLTQNGKASVVVLSLKAYEKLVHDAEEYQMDIRLRAAIEDYSNGNTGKPLKTIFGRIRRQTEKRRSSR